MDIGLAWFLLDTGFQRGSQVFILFSQ